MSLLHRVALVTGGAAGIGHAVCDLFLKQGARVALLDSDYLAGVRSEEEFRCKYGRDHVIFLPCDVSSPRLLEQAFGVVMHHWKQLNIVVNNAGIADELRWELLLRINLDAVIMGSKLGLRHMSREGGGGGGVIVNVSSLAGVLPQHVASVYSAAKTGVLGYTRAMGCEAVRERTGVRVNAVCPSFTETGMTTDMDRYRGQEEVASMFLGVRSRMQPNTIAHGILEMVTDEERNGAAMLITNKRGAEYLDFSEFGRRTSKM